MSACAYFDSSDNSLNFVENTGGWTNGQVVGTKTYYTGFETEVYNYFANNPPWYDQHDNVQIINFYISVIPISTAYWFNNFSNLIEINNLNLLDVSNATNINSMFWFCKSLTSLDLSSFDTSNVTDMSFMFSGCYALTSLNLSNFNTSNVTTMYSMFSNCYALTSLNLSSFNTSNVTKMNYMFNACKSLTSLDLSNFNTSNVTSMSHMFTNCESLKSFDLSNFNTSNVTDMSYMFSGCSVLTLLDLSSFDTSNVTNMDSMFLGCRFLTSLDLSSFNTSKVTNMSFMFSACNLLKYIRVSNLWSTAAVTNSDYMFASCVYLSNFNSTKTNKQMAYAGYPGYLVNSACAYYDSSDNSLNFVGNDNNYADKTVVGTKTYYKNIETSIYTLAVLPQWNNIAASIKEVKILMPVKPTSTSYWFKNCTNLSHIDLNLLDTSNVIYMSYMFEGCSSLTSLNLSNFNTNNVTDMSYMFYKCTSLTSLNLSSFDTSNVTDMIGMFSLCTSLTSLDLSNFNTSKVTKMGAMFENCKSLTSLNLSSFDTSNVIDMQYMFHFCKSLTSLNLSSFDTSNVTDMQYMFSYCRSLTSLDLSNFNTNNVTRMSTMFDSCTSLTSLNLSSFDTSNVTKMDTMFENCKSLTSLNLSSFDTSNVIDMASMFNGCTSLTSLDLSGFNTSKVTSMSAMFNYCSALTSLNLNSFNTSEVRYMHSMFSNCSSLTSLNLSSFNTSKITDVTSMFLGDSQLTVIIWDPDTTKDYSQIFDGVTDLYIIRPTNKRTDSTLATKWRNIIGNNSEVHFEYDHTLKPTITSNIERGKKVDGQWTPDDTEGSVIKLTYTPAIYQNDFSPLLETNALDDTARIIYSDNTDISNLVTYTTEGTAIIAEFDIGDAAQHNITLQLQDKHDSPTLFNITLPGIFAMIEFRAGGKGMSIGKVATRDGLDIAIPTTIGDNLLYPTIIENGTDTGKIDLNNFQFTIGQYNSKDDSKAFIIGNGGYDTSTAQINRSNALTVDWSGNTEQQGRATTNDMSTTDINNFVNNLNFRQSSLIDFFYPVGSYYETSDTTFDPNTAWGGTWVKDSAGKVTVAQDTGDTAFDTVGDTGGSKDIQAHTHGFTAPSYTTVGAGSHNHVPATANRVFVTTSDDVASGNFTRHSVKPGSGTAVKNLLSSNTVVGWGTVTNTVAAHSHTVNHTSGTGSVNAVSGASTGNAGNLQPYIVVNRWHRTA